MTLLFIDKGKTTKGSSLGEKIKSSGFVIVSLRCLQDGQMEMLSSQLDMQSAVRKDGPRDINLEAVNVEMVTKSQNWMRSSRF